MFKQKIIFRKTLLTAAVAGLLCSPAIFADGDNDEHDRDGYSYDSDRDRDRDHSSDGVNITFIHSGDFHGDYHPHTNGRADNAGKLEGGIARGVTVIKKIRAYNDNVIHVHTGDTIHGSGEASITKGMALVKLVDQLGIDVSTPGNWEFAYTPYRYMQFFGVHNNGVNQDIEDITEAARANSKPPMPVKYGEDEEGTVPTYGTPFRTVKYVASYNTDGSPNMAEGVNRWGMVASNVYENGSWKLTPGVKSKGTGMQLTPPYRIIEKSGVKIGFIGCTTNRGPQVVSSTITTGITFSNCKGEIKFPQNRPIDWDNEAISHGPWIPVAGEPGGGHWKPGNKIPFPADPEIKLANRGSDNGDWTIRPQNNGNAGYKVVNEIVRWTNYLREVEKVDLVAVMSEAGIAENVYAAENLTGMVNGPDIYFSSDMHEETNFPVVTKDPNGKKVIIIENPEDIAQISQLNVTVKNGEIKSWTFKDHDVNESVRPNWRMRGKVAQVDQEIADLIASGNATNPYNGHKITKSLYETVGEMDDMVLERNRFTNEFDPANLKMPGLVEGTGHDLVTDMFRKFTGADVGGIRGFRYTNSVLDGDDITYKALYHFFPIGPQVAKGSIPSTTSSETYKNGNPAPFLDASDPLKFENSPGINPRQFVSFPRSLQQEMELAGNSTMNPNIPAWGGGWFWSYSGIKFDLKPSGANFDKWGTQESTRVTNMTLYDNAAGKTITGASGEKVSYASYYYHEDYNRINRNQLVSKPFCTDKKVTPECVAQKADILILAKDASDGSYVMVNNIEYDNGIAQHNSSGDGSIEVLDTVEALARYISDENIEVCDWNGGSKINCRTVAGLGGEVDGDEFEFPRVNLVKADGSNGNDLTDCTVEFGFPCIQQIRGSEAGLGIYTSLPGTYKSGPAETPAMSGTM